MKTTLNRSIRIARTLLPALLVLAATGFAAVEEGEDRQSRRGARADFAERDAERMARVLQLTEDQKEQWRRLREEHEAKVGPLMRQMRDITERLESEANLENPDPTVVGQLELDRRAVARQLRTARVEAHEDATRLLDRDQRIRWEALQENGRGGFRGLFGPGGRGPRARN
ncbi:MAG: periplasmic heavy metal sensor [Holophagales bacterium]|nr:periplasmic heavy metal sensor [Holophagales bacterium]MYH24808.1 periplasmic heavy metal sensor [Holophagales bacterium]